MDDSDFEPSSEDVEFSAMGLDEEDLVDVRKQRIQFKDIPGSRTIRRHASDPQVLQNADDKQFVLQSMHNREARAEYNATIMPNKVVMVRHGQSEGNTNEALYSTTPDNSMRLTKLGWEQAREAGRILKEKVLIPGEPIHFIVSPYVRTVETFHGIVSAWCDPKEFSQIENRDRRVRAWYKRLLELKITWHEDPRLREQDFGNYQVPEKVKQYKKERHRFGPFFYRFPQGESASDVFDRVSTFLDSLWRSFDLNKSRNYILVTHGIAIRVLLARYFRYTIDQFSMLANPRNCEMVILGHDGAGKLQLDGRCELQLDDNKETGETSVKGHKFHRRLRVLPRQYVHKVNVRISHDDDVGPSQMVGRQSVSHIQGRIIEANENGDEYMLSDLQRPPLSNGETTSL
jgi:broad specificity phosphatase PhoE